MANSRIFFSYARTDSDFALKLATDLRNKGTNVWLDQLDILPGLRWDTEIERALNICDSLLVILSPKSVASNNVMDEISFALEEGKKVIPIIKSESVIPFRLKRLQYINFSQNYDDGLERLLKAIESEKNDVETKGGILLNTIAESQDEKTNVYANNSEEIIKKIAGENTQLLESRKTVISQKAATKKPDKVAKEGLNAGVVSIIVALLSNRSFIMGILAIIIGSVAIFRASRAKKASNFKMSNIGIILGISGIVVAIFFFIMSLINPFPY